MKVIIFACTLVLSFHVLGSTGAQMDAKSPGLIPWWSINTGGTVHTGSASYRLSSSVGQSVAGRVEGASHVLHVGFWNPRIIFVGVEERIFEPLPVVHTISQNYPNPFRGTTTIRYGIPTAERVKIEVFNVTGQLVRTLVDHEVSPGYRLVSWDGRDESGGGLRCGVYFYRMSTPNFQSTRKLLLLR